MSAAAIEAAVRAGGLLDGPVVVLYSGGRDSTCLLDLAARIAPAVTALHVNYGLRAEAGEDEAHCAATCARLGVPLAVRRPRGPQRGNLQAWARDVRYAEAARLAAALDARVARDVRDAEVARPAAAFGARVAHDVRDAEAARPAAALGALVAAGHTATDQVETVLYRLAASPGRRALLGMPARSGRLVRPLLGVTREETAAYCAERGLAWREDAGNAGTTRGRLRADLVPALRALHPAAEANVLRTLALLRDEAEVLDAAVDAALAAAGEPPEVARLAALPEALRRLAVQRLADRAEGGREAGLLAAGGGEPGAGGLLAAGGDSPGAAIGDRAAEILALGAGGGTAALDLPGGLRAVVEYGRLRIERRRAELGGAAPARLPVPGRTAYGGGELLCERGPDLPIADGTLDAAALAPTLEVRPWRPGDRMRPLGLGGSRSLQDLFTDRKVPRERRAALPVVLSDGEIAWVPGLATGERFRVTEATTDRVRLAWRSGGVHLDSAAR